LIFKLFVLIFCIFGFGCTKTQKHSERKIASEELQADLDELDLSTKKFSGKAEESLKLLKEIDTFSNSLKVANLRLDIIDCLFSTSKSWAAGKLDEEKLSLALGRYCKIYLNRLQRLGDTDDLTKEFIQSNIRSGLTQESITKLLKKESGAMDKYDLRSKFELESRESYFQNESEKKAYQRFIDTAKRAVESINTK